MIYGYARVSTKGQATKGNSLQEQERALKNAGCQEIIKESYTGTKINRPSLDALIEKLKAGDTLKVTKLDRIARSMSQGSELVRMLIDRNIKVEILNIGIMDNTPSSKLITNIFFSFAEFERDMIVERTQEGKAIAKTKPDYNEGRPKQYTPEQLNHAMELLENYSYSQVEKMSKISKSTLTREKRKRKNQNLI